VTDEAPSSTAGFDADPYDLVGIGIGPFNLSLAALAEPVEGLRSLFVDQTEHFSWHSGLLLEGTTLQVPFLADLVTLADPTSRWSFLAYLQAHDRLFPFYFAERFHIPRREYDHYCRWVAGSLASCRFGWRVESLAWDPAAAAFSVAMVSTGPTGVDAAKAATLAGRRLVYARNVVLGIGTEPVVPEGLRGLLGKEVFHAGHYLDHRDGLGDARDITVLGSGQSGAEVFLDLLRAQREHGGRLRWLTRSPAFAPMEYSKLGLEHFTPDYLRHFHSLSESCREHLLAAQWQLHKAISAETIAQIYDLLYERSIGGKQPAVTLMPNVEVEGGSSGIHGVQLRCRHRQQRHRFTVSSDRVVLATGYGARRPHFLRQLAHLVDWDERGRYRVGLDYRVSLDPLISGGLYVQNAEQHTHGVGTPDLGLGAWRAATILNGVAGRRVVTPGAGSAFTTFGLADPHEAGAA
jgi:lysine N6-hydroxylase